MKKLKKIVKLGIIYVVVTGYCCHVTDQFVMYTDPEDGIETGKLESEFPWKHIFDNCKILFNRLKKK
uniref:Poxvirus B22R protein N-terminal n=1 Tax=Siphoviridae sp. ctJT77 TaxID=2825432 RepID=A0A8S5UZM8_9CAUD|nr:MAG TPA: Poxvirus B22R protein N-terminal [Siphoviridae sp. ctJT77]